MTPDETNMLAPYEFHGITEFRTKGDEAYTECPFCLKDGNKFSINTKSGVHNCYSCGSKGNVATFLQWLWNSGMERPESPDTGALADGKKLLGTKSLVHWGVCKSPLRDEWICPGYNADGVINTVYALRMGEQKKLVWWVTTGTQHGLYGVPNVLNRSKLCKEVYVCEGLWDGCALWELLHDDPTKAVAAVPGCGHFKETWAELFSGLKVRLLYDNDHPKKNPRTKSEVGLQGYRGMQKAAGVLLGSQNPPASVEYLRWGPDGYDPDLPTNHDLRDVLSSGESSHTVQSRKYLLDTLLNRLCSAPDIWVTGKTKERDKDKLELIECAKWSTFIQACKKAMHWHPGLDLAASVMLAVIMSTQQQEEQLWAKIIGPPSCGKTTLANAFLSNTDRTVAVDVFRGFHSGMRNEGGGDNSLITMVKNKTLVTVDGDTLLQSPNFRQILSEGRRLYDRDSKAQYRNGVSYEHLGVNMTWLLLGTKTLRVMDDSELGERFFDVVVVDKIDEDEEQQIGLRTAYRVFRNMSNVSNGKPESRDNPEMMLMRQLGGGYAEYLCKNGAELLKKVKVTDDVVKRCVDLGIFVSFMRAKPGFKDADDVQREMSPRLINQTCKLAGCLAVVLNKKTIDEEVMRRVTRVATDTARGKTLDIASRLFSAGPIGMEAVQVAMATGNSETEDRATLKFMRKIGIVTSFSGKSIQAQTVMRSFSQTNTEFGRSPLTSKIRWALTDNIRRLYEGAMLDKMKKDAEFEENKK